MKVVSFKITKRMENDIIETPNVMSRLLVYLLSFLLAFPFPAAYADIIVDPNAPLANQATIGSANGVPLVNIVAPTGAGLSHNQFDEFSVDGRGAVLNNSLSGGQSVLGGTVDANPNLSGSSARVILNEVTSANETRLEGALEVFGDDANVIVANPNGVTCAGCGFINTNKATLTTGRPVLNGNQLDLQVREGRVSIEEGGLYGDRGTTTLAELELIGREVRLDAEVVVTEHMCVLAGNVDYHYSQSHSNPLYTRVAGATPASALAIDGSEFGALRAGRIHVMATDAGAGVRLHGYLGADAGDLFVQSAGDLSVRNADAGEITLSAQGDLEQRWKVHGEDNITIEANNYTSLADSELTTKDRLSVTTRQSQTHDGEVSADRVQLTAGQDITLSGQTLGREWLVIDAGNDITFDDLEVDARVADIDTDGTFTLNNSQLRTIEDLPVDVGGLVVDTQSTIDVVDNNIAINVSGDVNNAGRLHTQEFTLNADGTVTNSGLLSGQRDVDFTVGGLNQTATGRVQTEGNSRIVAGATGVNSQGALHSNGTLSLESEGNVVLGGDTTAQAITLASQANTTITGNVASNATTSVISTGDIDHQGELRSEGDLTINAANLRTQADAVLVSGENIQATVSNIVNNAGEITSGDTIALTAGILTNQADASISSQNQSVYTVSGGINNAGQIVSTDTLTVSGATINQTAQGTLQSTDALMITATADIVSDGTILSESSVALSAAGNTTLNGENSANDTFIITSTDLTTGTGGVISGSAITANLSGDVDHAGRWLSGGDSTLTANNVIAQANSVFDSVGQHSVTLSGDLNQQGAIQSRNLNISAQNIAVSATGQIDTTEAQNYTATGAFSNSGNIRTNTTLDLAANSASQTGVISAAQNITANINQALTNSGSITTDQTLNITANLLSNSSTIRANDLVVTAATLLNQGAVPATDALLLGLNNATLNTSNLLSNQGEILAGQNLTLNAQGTVSSTGLLQGNDLLVTGSSAIFNGGTVRALETLDVEAASLNNLSGGLVYTANRTPTSSLSVITGNNIVNDGRIVSQGSLALDSENAALVNRGKIVSVGDLRLDARQAITNQTIAQRATIYGLGNVFLTSDASNISNQNGHIEGRSDVIINAANAFENLAGTQVTAVPQDTVLRFSHTVHHRKGSRNSSGRRNKWSYNYLNIYTIEGHQELVDSAQVVAGRDLDITANNSVTNRASLLSAGRNLDIATGFIHNDSRLSNGAAYHYSNNGQRFRGHGGGGFRNRNIQTSAGYAENYEDDVFFNQVLNERENGSFFVRWQTGQLAGSSLNVGRAVTNPNIQMVGTQANITSGGTTTIGLSRAGSRNTGVINSRSGSVVITDRNLLDSVANSAGIPVGRTTQHFDSLAGSVGSDADTSGEGEPQVSMVDFTNGFTDDVFIGEMREPDPVIDLTQYLDVDALDSDSIFDLLQDPGADVRENASSIAESLFQPIIAQDIPNNGRDLRNVLAPEGNFFLDPIQEAQVLRQAAIVQTGSAFFYRTWQTDEEQQEALYANARALVENYELNIGEAIAPEIQATLTEPVIWYESRTIRGEEQLVPVVYMPRVDIADMTNTLGGAIIANNVDVDISGDFTNTGAIEADESVDINAASITNTERTIVASDDPNNYLSVSQGLGTITAADLAFIADDDITINGGSLTGSNSIDINAGGDVSFNAVETRSEFNVDDTDITLRNRTVRNQVTQLSAGDGGLSIQAGNNLTAEGTQFNATGDITLAALGDVSLLAVHDEDYRYAEVRGEADGGATSETDIEEDHSIRAQVASIQSGGDVRINVVQGEDGSSNTVGNGNVTLVGTQIASAGDSYLYAGDDLNVFVTQDYESRRRERHETRLGGLEQRGSVSRSEDISVVGSALDSQGTAALLAQQDINLLAANISAADIVAVAGYGAEEGSEANVNIIGAEEVSRTFEHEYETSLDLAGLVESINQSIVSVASGDHISIRALEHTESEDWTEETRYVGSQLNASNSINVSATNDITVQGSQLAAGENLILNAGNNLNILTGQNSSTEGSSRQEGFIGIETEDGGRLNTARYEGTETETTRTSSVGSSLRAGNILQAHAGNDANIIGSELIGNTALNIDAGRDINVLAGVSTTHTREEEIEIRQGIDLSSDGNSAELFAGVQTTRRGREHSNSTAAGEYAGDDNDNFALAGSTLLGGNVNLTSGRHTAIVGSDLQTFALPDAANDGTQGNINIDAGGDVVTTHSVNTDSLTQYEESLRVGLRVGVQENVSTAAESVEAAGNGGGAAGTLRAVDSVNSARSGAVSASVGIIAEWSRTESTDESSRSRSTHLNASNNLNITSGGNQRHTGTQAYAANDIDLDSGGDITIESAEDRITHKDKSLSTSVEVGLGTQGGLNVSGSLSYSNNRSTDVQHNNAHFTARNHTRINTANDLNIEGAQIRSTTADIDVGGDLNVASRQDTGRLRGESGSISASTSGNFGVGFGRTEGDKAWVNEQTGIYTTGELDVYVEDHTELTGAVINSDSGDLVLDTNTFAYNDIKDKDHYESINANVGFSVDSGDAADTPAGQSSPARSNNNPSASGNEEDSNSGVNTAGLQYTDREREQINRATIGAGTIRVRGDSNGTSTAGLNRDINRAQEITKDKDDSIDLYYSESSFDTLSEVATDPSEAIDFVNPVSIAGDVAASAIEGIDQLDNALHDAATLSIYDDTDKDADGNAITGNDTPESRGFLNDGNVSDVANDARDIADGVNRTIASRDHDGNLRWFGAGEGNSIGENIDRNRDAREAHNRFRDTLENQRATEDAGEEGENATRDGVEVVNNATDYDLEDLENVLDAGADAIAGNDVDTLLYNNEGSGVVANADGAALAGEGSNHGQDIAGINIDKVDVNDGQALVATLGEEVRHLTNPEDALANQFGDRLGELHNEQNEAEGRHTGGRFGVTTQEYRDNNRNNETVQSNNNILRNERPSQFQFRALRHQEAEILDTARQEINARSDLTAEEKAASIFQLDAIACAQVNCAESINDDDPNHENYKLLEAQGDKYIEDLGQDIYGVLDGLGVSSVVMTAEELEARSRSNAPREDQQGFEYTAGDWVNDILGRSENVIDKTIAVAETFGNAAATIGTGALTAASAPVCAGSGGLTCIGTVAGVGATAYLYDQTAQSAEGLSAPPNWTQGDRVGDSFSASTHQGDQSNALRVVQQGGLAVVEFGLGKLIGREGAEQATTLATSGIKNADNAVPSQVSVNGGKTPDESNFSTDVAPDSRATGGSSGNDLIETGKCAGVFCDGNQIPDTGQDVDVELSYTRNQPHHDADEFVDQAYDQGAGLSSRTAGESLETATDHSVNGRPSEASTAINNYRDKNPDLDMSGQDVLHRTDTCIGGDPSCISRAGDSGVNRSLGAQNGNQAESVREQLSNVPADMSPTVRVNIEDNVSSSRKASSESNTSSKSPTQEVITAPNSTPDIPETNDRPDFYVRPDGEAIPGTGYRHVDSNAPYLDDLRENQTIPANQDGTYFSFDRIDDPSVASDRLQVPHDAGVRVEFDTIQVLDDVRTPNGQWNSADYPEPITRDFPEFGQGGATQAITNQEIKVDNIVDLNKAKDK